ncbi:MAG: M4 family metallopeptidase [Gaiellales bacterium]
MLEQLAVRGSAAQRAWARHELQVDRAARARRGERQLSRRTSISVRRPGGSPERTIYDSHRSHADPPHGRRVRAEGWPRTGDAAVDEAYDGMGATYDLLWQEYGRNSLDDAGIALTAYVHFGVQYGNAFWDGAGMLFGDGDGTIVGRTTQAIDVIGHELTHGLLARTARLDYLGESGALNESICDVFGSLVRQRVMGHTAVEASWLIGEGVLAPGVAGLALRSLRAPGTAYDDALVGADPQPSHMRDYVSIDGSIHANSGIPNHAFYLAAVRLGGHAWERAGRVWYESICDEAIAHDTGFEQFAQLTIATAERLYGDGSPEPDAIGAAWRAVGVLSGAQPAATAGASALESPQEP